MKWAILWLVIAATVAFVIGSLNVPHFYRLVMSGVQAKATVLELTPQIHGSVRYEYLVGGRKFEGQRAPWRPNPPMEQIKAGESLEIYYDPVSPAISVPGDPKPMLMNELISVGMACLLVPTAIVFTLRKKK
jgi:hypothetical protein